jgi:hypothetical protein
MVFCGFSSGYAFLSSSALPNENGPAGMSRQIISGMPSARSPTPWTRVTDEPQRDANVQSVLNRRPEILELRREPFPQIHQVVRFEKLRRQPDGISPIGRSGVLDNEIQIMQLANVSCRQIFLKRPMPEAVAIDHGIM